MRQQSPMTDLSVLTGIYMRPLSKKEAIVEMMGTLLEFYAINGIHHPRTCASAARVAARAEVR